jgi:LMBR1-like membrane protein
MQTQGMALAPEEKSLHNTLKASILNCFQVIGNSFIRICTAKCLKTSYRILSVLCGVVSVTILWSELFLAAQWRSPVGFFMGAYGPQGQLNAVAIQGVSFFALSYMSICTYWSLFRLNLGWAYTLQGPQLSPPSSLIFNGEYFSRLQFALGYNFLMLLNIPG